MPFPIRALCDHPISPYHSLPVPASQPAIGSLATPQKLVATKANSCRSLYAIIIKVLPTAITVFCCASCTCRDPRANRSVPTKRPYSIYSNSPLPPSASTSRFPIHEHSTERYGRQERVRSTEYGAPASQQRDRDRKTWKVGGWRRCARYAKYLLLPAPEVFDYRSGSG